MRNIVVNLRRVPLLFYIISILICFVFILLSTGYFADNPADNQSMLLCIMNGKSSLSALVMWHNTLSSGDMNSWLLILTPLICCIGYIYTFCIGLNNKHYIFVLSRQRLTRFIINEFLGSGLYASIIMFSSLALALITSMVFCNDSGSYSDAPIINTLFHHQSITLAVVEKFVTYCLYAFFIGTICITLASFISDAFTSCSTLVLVLFLCGDIQSSYNGKFLKAMFSGNITQEDYNHFIDFLFVGNLAHGMPEFQNSFHVSYWIYLISITTIMLLLYFIFHLFMKKKVIL